jgi:hypothetical protein
MDRRKEDCQDRQTNLESQLTCIEAWVKKLRVNRVDVPSMYGAETGTAWPQRSEDDDDLYACPGAGYETGEESAGFDGMKKLKSLNAKKT